MSIRRAITALALAAQPALEQRFRQATDRDIFVNLVQGRNLTRLGVHLSVTPDGDIAGRAFGVSVEGRWNWRGGYFCREIVAGSATRLCCTNGLMAEAPLSPDGLILRPL